MIAPKMKGWIKLGRKEQFYVRKIGHTRYDLVVRVGYAKDKEVYWYALWDEPGLFLMSAQFDRVE